MANYVATSSGGSTHWTSNGIAVAGPPSTVGTTDTVLIETGVRLNHPFTDHGALITVSGVGAHLGGEIFSGGTLLVDSGASVNGDTFLSGATAILSGYSRDSSGGSVYTSVDDTFSSGAVLIDTLNATSDNDYILSGATTIVSSGGESVDYYSSGAVVSVLAGGTDNNANVSAGAVEYDYGKTLGNAYGGVINVYSGGTAISAYASGGGDLILSSGATGYANVVFNGGTELILGGATSRQDEVDSGGLLIVSSGALESSGFVSGGTELVSAGGTAIDTSIYSGGTLDIAAGGSLVGGATFADPLGGTVEIGGTGPTITGGGTISGWVPTSNSTSNTIWLPDFGSGATVTATATNQITITSGGQTIVLNVAGVTAGESLGYLVDSSGGIDLALAATCFLEGTRLAAGGHEVAVEALRAGDSITTLVEGELVAKTVKWVGHRSIDAATIPNGDGHPVRIRAGAFGDVVPYRDLLVTGDHCVFVDGGLIPARMLVNGRSIIVDRSISAYTYYHVELEHHGILIAEGLPTESYLDTGNRGNFINSEAPSIRPNFVVDTICDRWKTEAAAPLTVDRETVEPVWRILDERADLLGLPPRPAQECHTDPMLRLIAGTGTEILPAFSDGTTYGFIVPAGVDELRLVSRKARPADVIGPFVDDRRELGVLVGEIAVSNGRDGEVIDTHVTSDRLDGWHEVEKGSPFRWTTGNALLRLDRSLRGTRPVLVEIQVVTAGPYLTQPFVSLAYGTAA